MNTTNQPYWDRITDLIRKGLERSCTSLAFFLKEEVELETMSFSQCNKNETEVPVHAISKEIVLYSEIFGELKGKSFFKLDMKEANLLFTKNFPVKEGTQPNKVIFDGFLLEIDNIITASVVTEFANSLKVKAYGGVPKILYADDANQLELKALESPEPYFVKFSCRYKMKAMEFSPVFLWLMTQEIEAFARAEKDFVTP